jgi:U6 snRNA-associated Sm-like protein LSm4
MEMGSADGKIKYFRIADGILDSAMEEQEKARAAGRNRGGARGTSFLPSRIS